MSKTIYEKIMEVSVPYRGATFLNLNNNVKKILNDMVSVPYRGATFLNCVNKFFYKLVY